VAGGRNGWDYTAVPYAVGGATLRYHVGYFIYYMISDKVIVSPFDNARSTVSTDASQCTIPSEIDFYILVFFFFVPQHFFFLYLCRPPFEYIHTYIAYNTVCVYTYPTHRHETGELILYSLAIIIYCMHHTQLYYRTNMPCTYIDI